METQRIDISSYLYILLMVVTFLLSTSLKGQSFLKEEIALVEFNTSWNSDNHFKGLDKLDNCKCYSISLCDNPKYMDKFSISMPTIVVYHNGDEVKRYIANILFSFDVTYKNLQLDVDSLLLNKFN